ncbi:MAG TPA: hypothetical protein VF603_02985 [Allosphingosinicella sp.]|jgi:DNA-binding MarR family transcriptional regulator
MKSEAARACGSAAASLVEISRVLEETARLVRQHADAQVRPAPPGSAASEPLEIPAPLVRAILRIRRLRADYLPAAGGDPAWSMILELYAAELEGRQLNQSRLTLAAGIPHTTGLRITRTLIGRGVFVRRPDRADGRQLVLSLAAEAADKVRAYLTVAIATVPYIA